MNYARYASMGAGATTVIFSLLLLIFLFTGVSQQPYEGVRDLAVHVEHLKTESFWLQTLLVLDNIFITLYVTTSLLITLALRNRRNGLILAFFLAGVTLGGLLDFAENHHIAAQLASLTANIPISPGELQLQMVLSMLKWHLGYFAFFVVSFAIEPRSRWERIFQVLLWVQLPLGVMAYTTYTPEITQIFFLMRYFNLLVGFIAFGLLLRARSTQTGLAQTAADAA
ncbi:MAG: hypothetical protein K8I60_10930 [Anaerolineae bacterium]|nr:hypothetical protein [Anaerolineae bacterium]